MMQAMERLGTSEQKDYLTAKEALGLLNIRAQTLYAYVTRGWIHSISQPGQKERLYLRADIEKVRLRSRAHAGQAAVAASAMNYGEPIMGTAVTEITPDGHKYRGQPAEKLVLTGAAFETVSEFIWSGLWHETALRWPVDAIPVEVRKVTKSLGPLRSNDQLIEVLALVTLTLGVSQGGVAERIRSGRTIQAGRQLIQTLVGCFGYISRHKRFVPMRDGESVVDGLVRSLVLDDTDENRQALRTFLILFADHELSPGAFVARVAASSGATLHSCVAAAICTMSGVGIGRSHDRVEELFAAGNTKAALLAAAQRMEAKGIAVPGFTHPLYPKGDPRSRQLIELIKQRRNQPKRLQAIYGFIDEADSKLGLKPRHELGVVATAIAMDLPKYTAGSLFALARTAGLVAHVQEQRLTSMLLRPRARFVAD